MALWNLFSFSVDLVAPSVNTGAPACELPVKLSLTLSSDGLLSAVTATSIMHQDFTRLRSFGDRVI